MSTDRFIKPATLTTATTEPCSYCLGYGEIAEDDECHVCNGQGCVPRLADPEQPLQVCDA